MDKIVYRMSQAGRCARAIGASRIGIEPLPHSLAIKRILKESSRQEALVVEDLQEEGYLVHSSQREVSISHALFELVGHIDGIAEKNETQWVLEIKALGKSSFKNFKANGISAFPQYAVQVSCYSHALSLPILFCVKCRDTGEIIKTEILEPPVPIEVILQRLANIEELASQDLLPECDKGQNFFFCEYKFLCSYESCRIEKSEAVAAHDNSVASHADSDVYDLETAAQMWREGKRLERESESLIEEAKRSFRAHAEQVPRFQAHGLSVSLSSQSRKKIDEKKLIAMFGEDAIAPAISKTEYEVLRISETEVHEGKEHQEEKKE